MTPSAATPVILGPDRIQRTTIRSDSLLHTFMRRNADAFLANVAVRLMMRFNWRLELRHPSIVGSSSGGVTGPELTDTAKANLGVALSWCQLGACRPGILSTAGSSTELIASDTIEPYVWQWVNGDERDSRPPLSGTMYGVSSKQAAGRSSSLTCPTPTSIGTTSSS